MRAAALSIIACLLSGPSLMAQEKPRSTIAFFVGIERFDDDSQNNLKFVGEDTYAVWQRLKEVTNLDEKRSRLIIVDRDMNGALPESKYLRPALPDYELRKEFEEFVQGIQAGDLVVIYLQGHGQPKAHKNVYFLCSNFKRSANSFTGGVKIAELLNSEDLVSKLNVETVFFANMCFAAALPRALGNDTTSQETLEKAVRDGLLYPAKRIAYIPAAAGSDQAFEDDGLKRSEYAFHLLHGLGGAAADPGTGLITSHGLLKYLKENMSKSVPVPVPGFAEEIVLGKNLEREARLRRFLANSLVAVALDHTGTERSRFLKLAELHFARATEISSSFAIANLLSQYHCRRLARKTATDLDDTMRRELKHAQASGENDPDVKLATALLEKPAGPHFVAGIISVQNGPTDDYESWRKSWLKYFEGLSQLKDEREFDLRSNEIGLEPVKTWLKDVPGSNEEKKPDLVLVLNGYTFLDPKTKDAALAPEIWGLVRAWPSRCIIISQSSLGRFLLTTFPPDLSARVTIVSATSGPGQLALPDLLKLVSSGAFEEGLANFHPTEAEIGQARRHGMSVGVPVRVGSSDGHPVFQPVSSTGILDGAHPFPEAWWGFRFAAEGLIEPTHLQDLQTSSTLAWSDRLRELQSKATALPYTQLEIGALYEALGDIAQAKKAYKQFIDTIKPTQKLVMDPDLQPIQERIAKRLSNVRDQLRARELDRDRRLFIVSAYPSNYESPLVGDLRGPKHDCDLWISAFQDAYGNAVRKIDGGGTALSVHKALLKAVNDCGPQDTIVFLFSGRGYTWGGTRFLIMEDLSDPAADFPVSGSMSVTEVAGILSKASGRSLMLLDCQFGDHTPRSPLNKHLLSITPIDSEELEDVKSAQARFSASAFVGVRGPADMQEKVAAFWWASVNAESALVTDGQATTEFSANLIEVLKQTKELTLGNWVRRASELLRANRGIFETSGGYVAQGNLENPLLSGARGEIPLWTLLNNRQNKTANLEVAAQACKVLVQLSNRAIDRLTDLALERLWFDQGGQVNTAAFWESLERHYTNLSSLEQAKEFAEAGLLELYLGITTDGCELLRGTDNAVSFATNVAVHYPKIFQNEHINQKLEEMTERYLAKRADDFLEEQIERIGSMAGTEAQKGSNTKSSGILVDSLKRMRTERGTDPSLIPIKAELPAPPRPVTGVEKASAEAFKRARSP